MKKVICILGPTATGKTDLSIQLAEKLDGEIISVDSAMIYRGMDIGTAKPTNEERRGITHHLIDIIEPEESYSAARFCADSVALVDSIFERGKQPILVGGTMMYFNALFNGLSELPAADQPTRADISQRAESEGWPSLHQYLRGFDPIAADRIKSTDAQRICRAIEVYELTGTNITNLCKHKSIKALQYPTFNVALMPETRDELHLRIEKRFKVMLDKGLISEVRQLYSRRYLSLGLPSMRCVGYRQVWQHLEGEFGVDVMLERGIVATRQLAKRQLTWLRGMQDLHRVTYNDADLLSSVMKLLA